MIRHEQTAKQNLDIELALNLIVAPVFAGISGLLSGAWQHAFVVAGLALWLGANAFLIRQNKQRRGLRLFYLIRVTLSFVVAVLFALFFIYLA